MNYTNKYAIIFSLPLLCCPYPPISLEQHDAFYKKALASLEQSHFVLPNSLKSVEELQQLCRICGCMDDGTFVDLDKPQEFEFDSTIESYRTLFQRTSLQFVSRGCSCLRSDYFNPQSSPAIPHHA